MHCLKKLIRVPSWRGLWRSHLTHWQPLVNHTNRRKCYLSWVETTACQPPWITLLSAYIVLQNKRPMGLETLLKNQLGHGPLFQKLHLHSLSTTKGRRKWAYFRSMGSGFWDNDRFSKLPYMGMKLGKCPNFQNLHICPLTTPPPPRGGSKLRLFLFYGQRFPKYGPLLKFAIFGHETWQVASGQSSRSCTYIS